MSDFGMTARRRRRWQCHNFYLLVDDLGATIARAVEAGATTLMAPTAIDGYQLAMIKDPEGNPIGLIKPW